MQHQPDPQQSDSQRSLERVRERLCVQYSRHRNSAGFWDAYQALQTELADRFPDQHVDLCNRMAQIAQRLGAVKQAQLVGDSARSR